MTYEIERINREQSDSEVDPFTEGRYRQFARQLGNGFTGAVLDVGCNTGRGGRAFRASVPGVTVDGVELLKERIDRIPAGIYRTVYPGLPGDVPDEAGPYDALLMGELIEHVPYAELDDLIEQSTRLLVRGGRLLLTTPNPHRLRSRGTSLGGAHVSVHCAVALKQYLMWKGWEVKMVSGSGRLSGLIGEKLPLPVYGSYLLVARKPPAGAMGAQRLHVAGQPVSALAKRVAGIGGLPGAASVRYVSPCAHHAGPTVIACGRPDDTRHSAAAAIAGGGPGRRWLTFDSRNPQIGRTCGQ